MTAFDILEHVNTFYDTSWNHLLVYTGILAAVIGIIVPLLIQYYQTRLFRLEEEAVTSRVDERISQLKETLNNAQLVEFARLNKELKLELEALNTAVKSNTENLKKQSAEQVETARKEMAKQLTRTKGNIYHVQAALFSSQKMPATAADSMLDAALSTPSC